MPKLVLVSTLGFLLLAFSWSDLFVKESYQNLNNQQLSRLIEADNITIIDIRRAEEWRQTGVIKNSKLLTLFDKNGKTKPQFLTEIQRIPKDKPIAIICKVGNRSKVASRYLSKQGWTKVYNLKHGILSWKRAQYPLIATGY